MVTVFEPAGTTRQPPAELRADTRLAGRRMFCGPVLAWLVPGMCGPWLVSGVFRCVRTWCLDQLACRGSWVVGPGRASGCRCARDHVRWAKIRLNAGTPHAAAVARLYPSPCLRPVCSTTSCRWFQGNCKNREIDVSLPQKSKPVCVQSSQQHHKQTTIGIQIKCIGLQSAQVKPEP